MILLRTWFLLTCAWFGLWLVQAEVLLGQPAWLRWTLAGGIVLLGATVAAVEWLVPAARLANVWGGQNSRIRAVRPWVLDTSALIDGRLADVAEARFLDSPLVVPAFVIAELHGIANSSDQQRRARGRRGLDILHRLRVHPLASLEIFDRELPEFDGQSVDHKLVLLARHLGGRVVTNDFSLGKAAQRHGVEVLNLNELAVALRTPHAPGEQLEVLLVKPGEAPGQAVGYLDDGTMIVVDHGQDRLQQTVQVTVTRVLQTSSGRMIFAR